MGAFVLAATTMLGSNACAKDTVSAEDTQQTGSSEDSTTTTATESGDTDSTSSTQGDTTDSANTSNDSSLSFYAGPDYDILPITECDMFAQDCPEGEKCVLASSGGNNEDMNQCVPILGDGQPGEPCTFNIVAGTDDCDAYSYCWDVMDVDGVGMGVCAPFCTGTFDDPICPDGTSCGVEVSVCILQCDPLVQSCADGLGCYWTTADFNCIGTAQNLPLGDPCGAVNDCVPGTVCVATESLPDCNGAACCASYCSLSEPMCPQPGTECADFFEMNMAPAGYENIGVCILPP
jgi:hypothetical protein